MTGQAIGEVLALGVGVALSPLAIVAVVVMLVASRGTGPAWSFAAGWVASLTSVATIVVLIADGAEAGDAAGPATWVSVLKIVVGALLVLFAARRWSSRGGSEGEGEGEAPGWIRRLDEVTPVGAAGLAVLFNVLKPKNLLLGIAAGLAVAGTGASPAGEAVAVAVFVLLGTAGVAAPLLIHVVMPVRGRDVLVGLRDWMVRENTVIIAVLSLVIAAKLVGDAVMSLTG